MDKAEIERLLEDVENLRKAIRKNDPLLREVVDSRLYALLTLPFGLFTLVFFLGTHFLLGSGGSFADLPQAWRLAFWAFLAVFFVAGGIAKVVIIGRKAKSLDAEAGFGSVVKAAYGGALLHVNVPALVAMAVVSAYAALSGHPWLILPATAVFFSFVCNVLGALVGQKEYFLTGWYGLLSGLASLFFVEGAPYLWVAVVYGGIFLVFGAASLVSRRRRAGGR